MRLTMRAPTKLTMCCAAALFTLIAIVFAPSAKADTTCDTLLTSGTGTTFLKNCISKDGNVVAFESPQDAEHIAVGNIVGSIEEGYAICQGDAQHPFADIDGFKEFNTRFGH